MFDVKVIKANLTLHSNGLVSGAATVRSKPGLVAMSVD